MPDPVRKGPDSGLVLHLKLVEVNGLEQLSSLMISPSASKYEHATLLGL